MRVRRLPGMLFLEKVQKSLAVAYLGARRGGAASPFLDQDFGLKQRAKIVGALVRNPDLDGPDAFVSCRRIEVQAIAAGMKIGSAVSAPVRNLNLVGNLNFRCTVVAPGNQMKPRLHARARIPRPRRRLRPAFAVFILISVLTILSAHFSPWFF